MKNHFNPLLDWYHANRRILPWRENPTPYAVWVSEIMLQQTRVDTVIPYFQRWMEKYPDIESLSNADLQDVLRTWEGLGYYSRARNMHKAARIVAQSPGGELPKDVLALRKLPGIGPYTAGAIASIAFGLDEVLMDGNVRRVLSRVINLEIPADSPEAVKRLHGIAVEILQPGKAGDHNQALMELGALVCTPRSPACPDCPLQNGCESYRLGVESQRPILRKKQPVPQYTVTAAVIRRNGKVLITRRPEDGLLGGMWEFPGGKLETGEDLETCLKREILEELGVQVEVGSQIGVYRHAYTHFKVILHAFACKFSDPDPQLQELGVSAYQWVSTEDLFNFPMGKIDRSISIDIKTEKG